MTGYTSKASPKKAAKAALTPEEEVQFWLDQVNAAHTREQTWRDKAAKIVELYEGEKDSNSPFNILYSNTDTLLPALYSNTPRPQVTRRFKDADPLGAAVCEAYNRTATYVMNSNEEDYADFDALANQGLLEALVPGRGIIRWKYDATIVQVPVAAPTSLADATANVPEQGTNIQQVPETTSKVTAERVCGEFVPYDLFYMGFARKWKDVPWVDFVHSMTEDEVVMNFGQEVANLCTFTAEDMADDKKEKNAATKDDRKLAKIHEIWDKSSKNVIFVSPNLREKVLKRVPDPLKLDGFFPMDEPLRFLGKISTMVPTAMYSIYEKQAKELNVVTQRITAIVEMMKVRGFFDQTIEGLEEVLKSDDGTLQPIGNAASLPPGSKLSDAIWLVPIEPLVAVLQQLLLQRTNIKQVIYEITGISDILRGSTVASETATAQNIKNQWGTLRLKKMQKIVQRWSRNNIRIICEIAGKKFSQQTFQQVTGLPYVSMAEAQQAQQAWQQIQQQAMATAAMAQQAGQQPPPPPQPDPRIVQTLQAPVWEAVIEMMRNSQMSSYRVDIETNSTIADDMQEDQQDIGQLLNALSQYLNGVTPLIQSGALPFEAAKEMMLALVRRMAFGPQVEKALEGMQAPQQPQDKGTPPDPNIQLKQQAEAASVQLQMKKTQQDMEFAQQDHAARMQESQQKMLEMKQKADLATHTHNLKMEAASVKQKTVIAQARSKQGETNASV